MATYRSHHRVSAREPVASILIAAVLLVPAIPAKSDSTARRSGCGPFIIYHQKKNERFATKLDALLCESVPAIASETGLSGIDTVRIFIAGDDEAFRRLHGGRLPEWGEAFSDLRRNMIGIDAAAVLRSPRPLATVVKHELSHIFFSQRVNGADCPNWFIEGLAMRQSREWTLADQWNLVSSIWKRNLPDLEDLAGPFPIPVESASIAYKLSYAAVDRLIGKQPEYLITLTSFIRDTGDFERSFLLTFGLTTSDFCEQFHLDLEKKYRRAGALMQSTPFWIFMVSLFLTAYILKRYRTGRKVREWEEKEE